MPVGVANVGTMSPVTKPVESVTMAVRQDGLPHSVIEHVKRVSMETVVRKRVDIVSTILCVSPRLVVVRRDVLQGTMGQCVKHHVKTESSVKTAGQSVENVQDMILVMPQMGFAHKDV